MNSKMTSEFWKKNLLGYRMADTKYCFDVVYGTQLSHFGSLK